MNKVPIILVFFSLLSGCASSQDSNINWQSSGDVSRHITSQNDGYTGEITQGPNLVESDKALAKNFSDVLLARQVGKDGKELFGLYVTALYVDHDWRFYRQAIEHGGQQRQLLVMDRQVIHCFSGSYGCTYRENLVIPLTYDDFINGSTSGLNIAVVGRVIHEIKIPSSYFEAMLLALKNNK